MFFVRFFKIYIFIFLLLETIDFILDYVNNLIFFYQVDLKTFCNFFLNQQFITIFQLEFQFCQQQINQLTFSVNVDYFSKQILSKIHKIKQQYYLKMKQDSINIVVLKGKEHQYLLQLENVIGKGAVSEVFLGKIIQNDKTVAIKVLRDKKIESNQQNSYLQREYEVCLKIKSVQDNDEKQGKLNHNVLRILDCLDFKANENKISCQSSRVNPANTYNNLIDYIQEKYIITEYCNKSSLYDYLTDKGFSLQLTEVLDTSMQIAQGLKFLHDQKIMHRDLKPENIFVHEVNQDKYLFKIGDFGIGKQFQEEGIEQSFVGTINYMSPEVINRQQYSNQIDYWSLGCIIYEIYKGYQMFRGYTEKEVEEKIKNFRSQQHFVFSLNISLENIIHKCLVSSNQGGYQNIDQIINDIQSLQNEKQQQKQQEEKQFQLQQDRQNKQKQYKLTMQFKQLYQQQLQEKNQLQQNLFNFQKSPNNGQAQNKIKDQNFNQMMQTLQYQDKNNFEKVLIKNQQISNITKKECLHAIKPQHEYKKEESISNNSKLDFENKDNYLNANHINSQNIQDQNYRQQKSNIQQPSINNNSQNQNTYLSIQQQQNKQNSSYKFFYPNKKNSYQSDYNRLNNHKSNNQEQNQQEQQKIKTISAQNEQIARGSSCINGAVRIIQAEKTIKARSISRNKQYFDQ
ncbi:kinase domain protein (macronuclear) [Tetrahymena thermophila SB210]|uniref:IkappaB kinase n=1 Tax=Tetrahymena thermophila (strain SB210) TaxID=312017 RepID=A4VD69_TETTS|nr:kinase domain protein [Tetrahymena thermophila SB210]EDK31486.2 kinase domain protein [Tetrahymena thermophila SB210]|eukprot:XP_001470950.2 kinase domain protein [Tetrahymena thermophila SB210]